MRTAAVLGCRDFKLCEKEGMASLAVLMTPSSHFNFLQACVMYEIMLLRASEFRSQMGRQQMD